MIGAAGLALAGCTVTQADQKISVPGTLLGGAAVVGKSPAPACKGEPKIMIDMER